MTPEGIDVALNAGGILDINVSSVTVAPDLRESSIAQTDIAILDPTAMDPDEAAALALSAEYALAGQGDIVTVPWPQQMSLAPGVYVEHLKLTVYSSEMDLPFELTDSLYFEVTKEGIVPISMEDYSKVIEPPVMLEDGTEAYRVVDVATVLARRAP